MIERDIPKFTIKRLPVYIRVLDSLLKNEVEVVSSARISLETGFTPALIRKDLAFLGNFGTRGSGYQTAFLRNKIIKIIGLDKPTNIVVIGAGHLGTALTCYNITKNPYVNVVAVFESNWEIVGKRIIDVEVMHVSQMKEVVTAYNVIVAILAVTAENAADAAKEAVASGINIIYNFAPAKLTLPENIYVYNADLGLELQSLIYYATVGHNPG